jgi:8-oxo-dGTP pyrophosphatase MutT (NUDIX family)
MAPQVAPAFPGKLVFPNMAERARGEYPAPDADQRSAPSREALLRDAVALTRYLRPHLTPPPFIKLPAVNASGDSILDEPAAVGAPASAGQAAVLAAIYARDGAPWLLFTRRASGLSRHSGEISFPGGKRDATDLTLAHTALRETREELALDTSRTQLLGALPTIYFSISDLAVTTYIGWLGEGTPELTPARGEVAEVIYAPLLALDDPAIYHEEIWARGGVSHPIAFYDFGRHRIWGLTGRLLHDLLGLLTPRA